MYFLYGSMDLLVWVEGVVALVILRPYVFIFLKYLRFIKIWYVYSFVIIVLVGDGVVEGLCCLPSILWKTRCLLASGLSLRVYLPCH